MLDGRPEELNIDPTLGPRLLTVDGTGTWFRCMEDGPKWNQRDSADQKVLAYRAARANVDTRVRAVEFQQEQAVLAAEEKLRAAEERVNALRRELGALLSSGGSERELIAARCRLELERAPVQWTMVTRELVLANHGNKAAGLIYGLEFPWNEELLSDFGPAWLTRAFHAAGTLDRDNRVTAIILETEVKIDAGNNAGKFLFEVQYKVPDPRLHTRLFAKVPFKMTKETQSDRVSSSVMKQPMDLHEINTYRLLEASFPMATPKYYFADISCETSNFILITARIPYAEVGMEKVGVVQLEPMQVEGPYDKCRDAVQLRGDHKEYYMLLVKNSAKIAGLDKAGKMLSPEMMKATMQVAPEASAFKTQDVKSSGEQPQMVRNLLQSCITFMAETARPLFPEYVTEQAFQDKFINTMMTWSAYSKELTQWMHTDLDYVALSHANLNSDNAYFWRTHEGELDCGIIDWGGFAAASLGNKIWWCFNCADFEQFRSNLSEYIDVFVATYKESGGPQIDKDTLKSHVLLSIFNNCLFMAAAIPDCFRMCPRKEWETIKDRDDPRVASNVNGKSTLRTTLHVLNNCVRALEELGLDRELEAWIHDVWERRLGKKPKPRASIFG